VAEAEGEDDAQQLRDAQSHTDAHHHFQILRQIIDHGPVTAPIQVGVGGIGPIGAVLVLGLEVDKVTAEFAAAHRDQLTGTLVPAPLSRLFKIAVVPHSATLQLALQ